MRTWGIGRYGKDGLVGITVPIGTRVRVQWSSDTPRDGRVFTYEGLTGQEDAVIRVSDGPSEGRCYLVHPSRVKPFRQGKAGRIADLKQHIEFLQRQLQEWEAA
jgi:hypothetical protein